MVADRLGVILSELSELVNIADLKPDKHSTCLLRLPTGMEVQIELDKTEENLILGIVIGPAPPGAYRVRLFRRALQFNGLPPPRFGILAYSRQSKNIVLFEKMAIKHLTASDLASLLEMMIPKANIWIEALTNNEVPETPSEVKPPEEGGTVFGLKH